MELKKLLDILELDDPSEFEYFENLADLMETDEEIDEDVVFELLKKIERKPICEYVGNYFDDISKGLPDKESELALLFEKLKMVFAGLMARDDDDSLMSLAQEIVKYRKWCNVETGVVCKDITNDSEKIMPLREALAEARAAKYCNKEYAFDFSDCLDYQIEEYSISLSELNSIMED